MKLIFDGFLNCTWCSEKVEQRQTLARIIHLVSRWKMDAMQSFKFLMKWSRDHVLTSELNAGTWDCGMGYMTNVVLDD
jgi:hypothetical protein